MARPEKPIDWKKVDHLLMAGCKGTEICPHFDMHPNTFYRKVEEEHCVSFSEYSRIKKEHGASLLNVKQFEKALEKDNTMLIWLGKIRLGQHETEPVEYVNKSATTRYIEMEKANVSDSAAQPETEEKPTGCDKTD